MSILKEISESPKLSFLIWAILLAGLVLNFVSLVSVGWLEVLVISREYNMTISAGLWRLCIVSSSGTILGFNTCTGLPTISGGAMGGAQGVMATSNALAFTGLLVVSAFILSKAYRTLRTTTLLAVACTGACNTVCLGLMASNTISASFQLVGLVISAKLNWAFYVACASAGLIFISVLPSCFLAHKLRAAEVPFNRIA